MGQALILRRDGICIGRETDPEQENSSNSIAEGFSRIIFSKILGSKMLVFFPEEPEKAIHAFLPLVEKLQKIERIHKTHIFAGAHAGEVIAGLLGVGDQCDFTMIGDAVNTAARIEAVAEKMQDFSILVSDEILELTDAPIQVHRVGSINLKGKKDAVALFALE